MKYIIGLLAMLLPILCGAQSPPVKALHIGDTVPDITISNILNYKTTSASLSDFKGKLIILDFWSSWCSSCIALFPHLDSLQRSFEGQLQVFLVNTKSAEFKDDAAKIKKIITRVNEITGNKITLPVIYNSAILDAYFPCIILPHEVWISSEGKVLAITGADAVTSQNISAFLNEQKPVMRLKQDAFNIDIRKPLFIDGNGTSPRIRYRSLITEYLDGVAGGSGIREHNSRITGFYSINQSLFSLTKIAYSNEIPFADNRIVCDVNDLNKFRPSDSDTGAYKYQYCYELIADANTVTDLLCDMQKDLRRNFNISVLREKRKMKCLVLSNADKPAKEFQTHKKTIEIVKASEKNIHDQSPSWVVHFLNLYSLLPVIDQTDSISKISVCLPANVNDITALKAAFSEAGISVSEEERKIEVVVISDK
jgi:thiol-disulfide isomerase/thioredoxin